MAPAAQDEPSPEFEHSVLVNAAPTRVLAAFFDPHALAVTPDSDDLLGRLGGVFHGTVMEYLAGRELFVADAWWLPPDGDPIGPMALAVSCRMSGPVCKLHVKQTGFENTPRWRRYYAVIASGWRSSLSALKEYVENAS
jgi:hypothetical protein